MGSSISQSRSKYHNQNQQKATIMGSQTPNPKYDKNKDLARGELSGVFVAGLFIPYVKKDDFKFTPQTIEIASKMSGKSPDKLGGRNDWSASIEAYVSNADGHLSYNALENIAASGKAVTFEICKVTIAEAADGTRTVTKGDVIRKGMVTISDLNKNSTGGEYETFTCTLNGSGPLQDKTGKEIGSTEALTATGVTI